MKLKTLFCASIISTLLVACGGTDPESLGKDLFEKLQSGDKDSITNLSINEDDYYWLISKTNEAKASSKSPTPSEVEKKVKKTKRKVTKNVGDILSYGKMHGGWENASLVKVEVKAKETKGIEGADIYLHVEMNEKQYRVLFDDLVNTDRGWVMSDSPRWLGLSYDPQFDKLIGEKLSVKPNNVFVSCKTPLNVTSLDILLRGKNNDSEVSEFLNSGKCSTNKSSSAVTVTIEELGEYTMDAKRKFANNEAEFPFEKIKISFEIDGQQKSGWTYTRWLASQAQ